MNRTLNQRFLNRETQKYRSMHQSLMTLESALMCSGSVTVAMFHLVRVSSYPVLYLSFLVFCVFL